MLRTGLLLVLLGFAAAGWMDNAENITVLTTENFDEFLDAHPTVLVEFYMPVRVLHVASLRRSILSRFRVHGAVALPLSAAQL